MKLSMIVSAQPTSFSAIAYQAKLAENIMKIKAFGYDGVELAVRDPNLIELDVLKSLLHKNAIPISAIGTGQAFQEEGLSLTHYDSQVRKKTVERIKGHIDFAANFNAIVIIGLIRGNNAENVGIEKAKQWLTEALSEVAKKNTQVKIAIEPINRYETDLINTVDSGLRFLEKMKLDNMGLLLDTFHMNIEEPSITSSIVEAGDRLFHFHIADSNRWYPGAGHINFKEIVETLDKINYKGFCSAEILPLPDPDVAAKKTIENLRSLER